MPECTISSVVAAVKFTHTLVSELTTKCPCVCASLWTTGSSFRSRDGPDRGKAKDQDEAWRRSVEKRVDDTARPFARDKKFQDRAFVLCSALSSAFRL